MNPDDVEFKVIQRKGKITLVEYVEYGATRRVVLPTESVLKGELSIDELSLGIPWGIAWEDLIEVNATPGKIANELRKRGIWTIEDLRKNVGVAVSAFQAAHGADVTALLRLVSAIEKDRG